MVQQNDKVEDFWESNIEDQNIFEEFTESEKIQDEVKNYEQKQSRDLFYYLRKINTLLFSINVIIFIGLLGGFLYTYVQSDTSKKTYDYLNPICNVFLWDIEIELHTCYGVSKVLSDYTEKLEWEKMSQARKILPLIWDLYSIDNFNLSKKVSFLLDKSESRLRPLKILWAFDEVKSAFAPIDKSEISCYDILIGDWDILTITCDAFSPDWDTKIVDLQDGNIWFVAWWGTSISRASSFIHFLENYSKSPFQVLQKPKKLSSETVQSWPYTQKTTIQLRLQYFEPQALTF